MSITLVSDPIMGLDDALQFLSVTDDNYAAMIINSLTRKFRQFTGRVQLNEDTENDVVEYLRGATSGVLYLHCCPIITTADTQDVTVEIIDGHTTLETYSWDDEELQVYSDDTEGRLESVACFFPSQGDRQIAKVTYRGGWPAIPGDVMEGAILQGKVDLNRLNGEIGVTSRSSGGESTDFDTRGIIKTVQQLWFPYRTID